MNDTNTTYDTAVRDADFDDCADSATAVTSDASDADEIAMTLAQWWQTNARDLPWRFGRTTPWGVLVSEVMSQQTQMGRVVPYWTAWMDRWPDAAALADAPKSDVITAWGRLGYPRRALRLQECAHVIAYDYADELPPSDSTPTNARDSTRRMFVSTTAIRSPKANDSTALAV